MTTQPPSLEGALEAVERDADSAIRALTAALKAARKAKSAASVGIVRDLQQATESAFELTAQAATAADDLRRGWQFDVGAWFSSGQYAQELLATAAALDVQAFESDDRILCYPTIVQVAPADATVMVDKQKDRRVRPSVLVRHLQALQQRPPKFKPESFIESLAAAYDYVVGAKGLRRGAPAKLIDVHRVLTLLPGAARDYTRQEFARDMYLLDQSGVVEVRDGRQMSLPASALTRGGGVLTTVTRSGQSKIYAGLAFTEPRR
ncbi:MAG: hypothetical protein HKL89_09975 [Candidatus Dormibacteraeota bacterium]|nr:hypothetical protein [Candidatus Dormibacteraeota bacterium]